METESPLPAMLSGLFQHTLLRAGRRGENPDFAVGENAVNVEENELDLAGASSGGWFRHRRDSSRLRAGSCGGAQTKGPSRAQLGLHLQCQWWHNLRSTLIFAHLLTHTNV